MHVFPGKFVSGSAATIDLQGRAGWPCGVAASGRQARLTGTKSLSYCDLCIEVALGGGGTSISGPRPPLRETAIISCRVETHELVEIRDLRYVSEYPALVYIDTGAVSRTSLNCAPLSTARRIGSPGAPRSVRWLLSSHATFHQGEM